MSGEGGTVDDLSPGDVARRLRVLLAAIGAGRSRRLSTTPPTCGARRTRWRWSLSKAPTCIPISVLVDLTLGHDVPRPARPQGQVGYMYRTIGELQGYVDATTEAKSTYWVLLCSTVDSTID